MVRTPSNMAKKATSLVQPVNGARNDEFREKYRQRKLKLLRRIYEFIFSEDDTDDVCFEGKGKVHCTVSLIYSTPAGFR